MAVIEVADDGVVEVDVGAVLIAGGNAVSGNDGAVHGLVRVNERRNDFLRVDAVDVGVVEKSLGLEHVDVGDLRELRIGLHRFGEAGQLVGLGRVDMRSGLPGGFGDVERGAEAGHAAGLLVLVGFEAFDGLEYEDGVHRLRERRVVGSGALHVDDAFLESDDAAAGEDGGAFEDEGLSASDGLNVAQHAGEYLA